MRTNNFVSDKKKDLYHTGCGPPSPDIRPDELEPDPNHNDSDNWPKDQVQLKFKNLRTNFLNVHKKICGVPSGSAGTPGTKWPLYDIASFLPDTREEETSTHSTCTLSCNEKDTPPASEVVAELTFGEEYTEVDGTGVRDELTTPNDRPSSLASHGAPVPEPLPSTPRKKYNTNMAGRKGLDEEGYLKLLEDLPSDYDTDTEVEPDEDSECEDNPGLPSPSYLTYDPLDKAQSKNDETTDQEHSSRTPDQERPSTSTDDEELPTSSEENHPCVSGQGCLLNYQYSSTTTGQQPLVNHSKHPKLPV
ncbi:hypothetical protein Pcinc_002121 [Petrolisthes cinctipes]|uniref:Uncharacterized protein n=1 Tax=Petrolisthes cinctipes TaxID=88211 RepID=A0AAE1GIT4_PETCI|nr:hypothetical protein Pcinc_002121 [Petrolisthes cinctipes]